MLFALDEHAQEQRVGHNARQEQDEHKAAERAQLAALDRRLERKQHCILAAVNVVVVVVVVVVHLLPPRDHQYGLIVVQRVLHIRIHVFLLPLVLIAYFTLCSLYSLRIEMIFLLLRLLLFIQ